MVSKKKLEHQNSISRPYYKPLIWVAVFTAFLVAVGMILTGAARGYTWLILVLFAFGGGFLLLIWIVSGLKLLSKEKTK